MALLRAVLALEGESDLVEKMVSAAELAQAAGVRVVAQFGDCCLNDAPISSLFDPPVCGTCGRLEEEHAVPAFDG